jgi:hypothetical protein
LAELEGQDYSAAGVEGSIGDAIPFPPNPKNDQHTPNVNTRAKMPSRGPWPRCFLAGEGVSPSGSSSLTLQRTLVKTTPLPSSPLRSHINRAIHRHLPWRRIISWSAQDPRLHATLIPNSFSGDNGLHRRGLCQAPIYSGRKPPHAYALSISVNAFEREAKENSATLVGRREEAMAGEQLLNASWPTTSYPPT